MKTNTLILLLILIVSFLFFSCKQKQKPPAKSETTRPEITIVVPEFNADSAFAFIKAQCDFGPRVPGSKAYAECASFLENTLKRYTPRTQVQQFKARLYNNNILTGKNFIATFNPDQKARIMLCAHWDSRPFADHDPDLAKRNQPVMGANDGASGVGLLLEVARLLAQQQPKVGVDIVFFDLEDYGPPQDPQKEGKNEYWGLGSQYWSRNPHVPDYRARFVILLDMIGSSDAKFYKEGFSEYYAPDKLAKVWNVAHRLGYQDYFLEEHGGYINDDHYFINEIIKIPAIDIIHLDKNSSNGSFYEYWHTTGDTFDKIDKETLRVVGNVVMRVVFEER